MVQQICYPVHTRVIVVANNETIIVHGNSFIIMFLCHWIISKQGGKYDIPGDK